MNPKQDEELDPYLKALNAIFHEYRFVTAIHQNVNAQWATWNYWAEAKPWYQEWKEEHGLKDIDVRWKQKNANPKTKLERDEGIILYAHRSLKWRELEQIRLKRSQLLKELLYMRNEDDTDWKYSGEELAKAAGYSTSSGLWRMLEKQDWFEYRRDRRSRKVAEPRRKN